MAGVDLKRTCKKSKVKEELQALMLESLRRREISEPGFPHSSRRLPAEVSAPSFKRLPSLLRTASRESRELQLAGAAQAGQPGQVAAKRAHGRHAPPGEAHVARAP
ncbi:unnamed protein product [Symbiodinium natans]|uniref:Uncharacterized protein n=1 Tax=Symbiodinium natans TaxID=878477 RepID=A0A812USQ3_9DINO|nr:unnamed protein product [Symbiodinium natans]